MKKFVTKSVLSSLALVLILSGSAAAISGVANDRAVKAQEAVKMRLEGAKLRACENRERVINNILDKISQRGEKRLDVYNKIFQRVQDFYVKKGLSISNYDQLVADVNAKKAAAQATVDRIKNKQVEFKCDGTDPKGAAAGFKTELKAQIKALHDYQQSIKNLIVAVKTAQSSSDSSQGSDKMSTKRNIHGFTVLEVVLLIVIAALVGLVGYKIYNTNTATDKSLRNAEAVLDQTPVASGSVPAAINSISELEQVEKTLADYDSSGSDDEDLSQLDSQLSAF